MIKQLIFAILLLVSADAIALDELLPASIEQNDLNFINATFDGEPFTAWYMPDMDADGKAELRFVIKQATDTTCVQLAIVPSSFQLGVHLTSDMLPNLIYWIHTREPDEPSKVNSNTCLNTYPAAIGDINNDGLNDFFTRNHAVVFGTITPGTVIDTGRTDGSLATVFGEHSYPKSVGDVDGDGLNDLLIINIYTPREGAVVKGGFAFSDVFDIALVPDEFILFSGAFALGAGDLNGDGINDLLLNNGYLIYGEPNLNVVAKPTGTYREGAAGVDLCIDNTCSIKPIGDFDADGFDDIYVTHFVDYFAGSTGQYSLSSILYGSKKGVQPFISLIEVAETEQTRLITSSRGHSYTYSEPLGIVGNRGDFNGDGAADVKINNSLFFSTAGSRKAFITIDDVDGGLGVDGIWSGQVADVDHDGIDDFIRTFGRGVFFGKNLRTSGLPDVDLIVRQLDNDYQLLWQPVSDASIYRVSVYGVFEEEVPGNLFTTVLIDPEFVEGTIITIEALDSNGVFLARTLRRLNPWGERVELSARIYSKNQIELYMNTPYYEGSTLILRNGKIINVNEDRELGYRSSHDGRDTYVDRTVMPGETYSYTVIPNYQFTHSNDLTLLDREPSKQFRSKTITVTVPAALANDEPLADHKAITYVVEDQTIHWISNGKFQVLDANDYTEICGEKNGGLCEVTPGTYILINLSSDKRVRVVVPDEEGNRFIAPVTVSGNIISWPDNGWYQVLNQTDYSEVCAGGRSCEVPRGSYIVINHTTKKRIKDVQIN